MLILQPTKSVTFSTSYFILKCCRRELAETFPWQQLFKQVLGCKTVPAMITFCAYAFVESLKKKKKKKEKKTFCFFDVLS